jgi:hypothetical protein
VAKQQPKTDEQKKLEAELKAKKAAEKKAAAEAAKDQGLEQDKDADDESLDDEEESGIETDEEKDSTEDEGLKTPPQEEPKVKVFSQVHMTCLDGTKLVIGEFAHLAQSEYERLKKDARGPFFKE